MLSVNNENTHLSVSDHWEGLFPMIVTYSRRTNDGGSHRGGRGSFHFGVDCVLCIVLCFRSYLVMMGVGYYIDRYCLEST